MKRSLSLILIMALLIGIFYEIGEQFGADDNADALNVTILVPSQFGDKSINDAAHDGGILLEERDMNVKYTECHETDYKQQTMTAAGESDVVVCVGWEFWEISDVATQFPAVKFIWIDNTVEYPEDYPNLLNVVYAQNEPSYLAGYMAAAISQTGTVGVLGGNDDDTTNDFITGFTQGAEECNGRTNVLVRFADGNYNDPELGKALSLEMNDERADVIFQVAGATGEGVFQAAQERGFYAIGVDKDQRIEYPEYCDVILCSVMKNIGQTIYRLVKDYRDNDAFDGGTTYVADMESGLVAIGYGDSRAVQLVNKDLRDEISEIGQQIIENDIKVNSEL